MSFAPSGRELYSATSDPTCCSLQHRDDKNRCDTVAQFTVPVSSYSQVLKQMGSWWRSESMTYVSIIFSEEASTSCIRELGVLGCIQFTDLNPELTPFQRRFVSYIKRCDEIERKLRYVNGEVKKMGVPIQPAGSIRNFVENNSGVDGTAGLQMLENLESKLELFEQQLLELNRYSAKLTEEYTHKVSSNLVVQHVESAPNHPRTATTAHRLSSTTCSSSPASFLVKRRTFSDRRRTRLARTIPRRVSQ
jgi:hypothetical protein